MFKSKKAMSKPHTKRVKLNKYTLTSHAQNRIAEKPRNITKFDVIDDLYRKELYKSPQRRYVDGTMEYTRIGRRLTSYVASKTNNIKSIHRNNEKDVKRLGLVKKKGKVYKYEGSNKNK